MKTASATDYARMRLLATDKDDNYPTKENIAPNHIPIQRWCYSDYQSTHFKVYTVFHKDSLTNKSIIISNTASVTDLHLNKCMSLLNHKRLASYHLWSDESCFQLFQTDD